MENMVNMFESLQRAYKGKKVFLTGHTGFKGAWLLKVITLLGAEVKGYALAPPNSNDLFNLIGGQRICDSVIADLRDKEALQQAVSDFEPDFIFHLAAQPLVRLSYEVPSETFEVNAIGTANLLDTVRLLKNACTVVLITTDKVYHNYEWNYPYREIDRLGGYDPYSASKACAELVIDSYRNSFFNVNRLAEHKKGIAVGRAGNVIGGGDWAKDRLIPDIIKHICTSETVVIRNPNAVRPWQHVLEPLKGYLLLGAKLALDPVKFSQAYNFGPLADDAIPVHKMTELIIKRWGSGVFESRSSYADPHEAGLLKLDISKAINELQWRPRLTADQAIRLTTDWYKKYIDAPGEIEEFTSRQIVSFLTDDKK